LGHRRHRRQRDWKQEFSRHENLFAVPRRPG
jgi:hypothetical protein